MKFATPSIAVISAGFAIALIHCGSSSSEPSAVGADSGHDSSAPLGPATDHYPAGSSCRTTRSPTTYDHPIGDAGPNCGADAGQYCSCGADSDCANGRNGRCYYAGNAVGSICSYDECSSSSDCASGTTCACGDLLGTTSPNTCVPSNCRYDTDCTPGESCSPSESDGCLNNFFQYTGVYCHTPQDDCNSNADCKDPNKRCIFSSEEAKWTCQDLICGAG